MAEINERLREPLKLFLKELDAHLENLSKGGDLSTPELLEQTRKRLESRFHLIKGSAGFFSMKRVVELASRGEETMKRGKSDAGLVEPFVSGELPGIVQALREELQVLKAEYLTEQS